MRHKDESLMRRIRAFAEEFFLRSGRSPSMAEIGSEMGISRGTAHRYLVDMNDRGLIVYDGKRIMTEKTALSRPKVTPASMFNGEIPCGPLDTVEAAIEGYICLPSAIFGDGELYIIRAQGDSMVCAGIEDGDMVVVDKSACPVEGDIVVAMDDTSRNTLKRMMKDRDSDRYYLHPENPGMADIYVNELMVQGVAKYVIKSL